MSITENSSTSDSTESTTENSRRYNTKTEDLIMLTSTLISLQLSQGKTAGDIEYIALVLENVALQLGTIADLRILTDKNGEELFSILPIL